MQLEISVFFHPIPVKGVGSGRLTTSNCVFASILLGKSWKGKVDMVLSFDRIVIVKNQLESAALTLDQMELSGRKYTQRNIVLNIIY